MGQKSLSTNVLLEGWNPIPTFSAGEYLGSWVFHYSSWLCGHPLQLTNTKPGACADWAGVSLVSSASSQGDMRDGGGSERLDTVSLSEVLDQVLM